MTSDAYRLFTSEEHIVKKIPNFSNNQPLFQIKKGRVVRGGGTVAVKLYARKREQFPELPRAVPSNGDVIANGD